MADPEEKMTMTRRIIVLRRTYCINRSDKFHHSRAVAAHLRVHPPPPMTVKNIQHHPLSVISVANVSGRITPSCNERVVWEIKTKNLTEARSKENNLPYRRKVHEPEYYDNRGPYIASPICGGCNRGFVIDDGDNSVACVDKITEQVSRNDSGRLMDAAKIVAREYKEGCGICDPDWCWERYHFDDGTATAGKTSSGMTFLMDTTRQYPTKYWRFDRVTPPIRYSSTLVLPSIPKDMRIPPSAVGDILSYLNETYAASKNHTNIGRTRYIPFLIEYNPGQDGKAY